MFRCTEIVRNYRRSFATWQATTRAGLWWPGSPTTMLRTGWRTTASIGTTNDRLSVKLQIPLTTQTWSPRPFGPSLELSSRSPAATTPATQLCCRPHPTACRDRRSALNSQVTATSGMEKRGPGANVLATVTCNMADGTAARTGFSRLSVMATFRPGTRSASGVTGRTVTAQWWWLAGEGGAVAGLITGLESQRLMQRLLLSREAAKRSLILVLTQTAVARPAARTPSTCGFASASDQMRTWLRTRQPALYWHLHLTSAVRHCQPSMPNSTCMIWRQIGIKRRYINFCRFM